MPRQKQSLSMAFSWPVSFWLIGCGLFLLISRATAQTPDDAQKDFLHGHYDAVIKTAKQQIEYGDYSGDWHVLLTKALLTVGRYAEAHTNAILALNSYSGALEKRLLLRETYLYQNDTADANEQLSEIQQLVEGRSVYLRNNEPVALGRALLLLGVEPRLVLDNCFRPAESMVPPQREAFLASGQLALDKHDFKLAGDVFRAGLKKFPDDPDLHWGLAKAFESGDRAEMLAAIHAALDVNPQHIPSLLLLADHLIDAEEYDEAGKQLDLALKVNPHRPEALAYRAVLAHLRNDPAGERKFHDDALAFWKSNPQVDYLIGTKLAQKYRFAEGAAAQKRSLDFDPTYLPARRELAQDFLRLGQDDEGWKLADQVRARDDYDVEIYNLVTLHDQIVKYQKLTNADFVVRMQPHEAQLYGASVLELLSNAKATLSRKYGVELTQRTLVDIFPEQKDFGVRTFGMPDNPGYLGVCFGSVITANSPASQAANPANWKDVLWHEFCHVITLNETKNRMPRWLSEGISVYEERQANPAWGERMDLAYREMISHGELTALSELSGAFLAPKNPQSLQFAYFESSLVVEYIVQQYGLESLKQILKDLGDGKEINQAIAAHTCPMPELEKKFAAFAKTQANNLAPGVDLEKPPGGWAEGDSSLPFVEPKPTIAPVNPTARGGSSEGDAAAWKQAHPKNYYVRLEQAAKLLEAKNWAEAKTVLEPLAADYSGERRADNPLWLLAAAERHLGDTNAELATLQKFAEHESDFVDLYVRLVEITGSRQDWPAVTKYAQQLLAINPLIPTPYTALAEAGAASGQNDIAIDANRKLLLLDPPDAVKVHYQLACLLHARGDSEAEAKRQVLQALEDAPRYRDAQQLLLKIEDKKESRL
jgi:tetratricopeptide (TPR) repeat protein